MKEKYFNVNELSVGCLGSIKYLGMNNGAEWNKKIVNPYIIFKKVLSDKLDDCHEGKDIFSYNSYYFLNEVSRKDSTLEIINGKYTIGKSIPLSVVCGNDMEKISSNELKSIICNFNLTDALIKNKDNKDLLVLKECLDIVDLINDYKVREYYIDRILSLINNYDDILENNVGKDDISSIRYELEKEKEICVKKVKKVK